MIAETAAATRDDIGDDDIGGSGNRIGSLGVGLAALLGFAAFYLFVTAYVPYRRETARLDGEIAAARERIHRLDAGLERLRQRRAALEAGEPAAVEEAVRENLRQGRAGEFVVQEQ